GGAGRGIGHGLRTRTGAPAPAGRTDLHGSDPGTGRRVGGSREGHAFRLSAFLTLLFSDPWRSVRPAGAGTPVRVRSPWAVVSKESPTMSRTFPGGLAALVLFAAP